jgi:hypothetical protein
MIGITAEQHPSSLVRQRSTEIRRLVAELANRMWAPDGIPARFAVALPPSVVAALRIASSRLDPGEWYELDVTDGYWEFEGAELLALCRILVVLAEAQMAGDLEGTRVALEHLAGSPGH